MAGFLYYIKTAQQSASAADVAAWGLAYAFEGDGLAPRCQPVRIAAAGPKAPQGEGLVIVDPRLLEATEDETPRPPSYEPDQQTWVRLPDDDGAPERWVGFWRDDPPAPADLERPDGLPGFEVKGGDGHDWRLPLVRSPNETGAPVSRLPAFWAIDAAGDLIEGDPIERYDPLWDLTEEPWAKRCAGEAVEYQEAWRVGWRLLQANYRVGPAELIALRVSRPDQPSTHPTVWVSIAMDFPAWEAWKKAKDADPTPCHSETGGSDSSATETASPHPATGQPAPK